MDTNKKFYPTRSQSDYILTNNNVIPKIAKKWVELDPYFAKKIADEKLYTEIPKEVWVEKLLVERDKDQIYIENIRIKLNNSSYTTANNCILYMI